MSLLNATTQEALDDSGIDTKSMPINRERFGVYVASTSACSNNCAFFVDKKVSKAQLATE
jgi:hypothetical protein